ncbi:amidohydrolase [Anaeromyxobacter diazotrophicus]|uniref:Amidohydrolase n=1 Tax=Anaeromyxobacter diazotrophicus TaxID=2590199 RepID=A0A7I9VQL3_9BACT|nr:amidohydrolase [Anaeromyxobacter diazotrophicus]GEJ58379.1 amidohydrolase [Anaeromyxobacter diazotrophicus]
MKTRRIAAVLAALCAPAAFAAGAAPTDAYLDETRGQWEALAQRIWEAPEVGLQEVRSSAMLAAALEQEGFKVTRGVPGLPTAFVATAGSGEPVVTLLAEYDALPALSQVAGSTKKQPIAAGAPGHACGHNLLGTAAVAGAAAANRARLAQHLPGTIQVLGTPAEEQFIGKAFMARDGLFAKSAAVLTWHPDDQNRVVNRTRLAVSAADVEFFGKSAHASASPWLGRSSLDALALFDHAMALMREHVKPTARIHRVVKDGGAQANIIPDYTRGQYWLRDATGESVEELMGRLRQAADGAALATGTRAKVTVLFSARDVVPNDALGKLLHRELERVGAPAFDAADVGWAQALQREVGVEPQGLSTGVVPYAPRVGGTASSDIGEVSAVAPLAELGVAVRPIGTAAHHWAQTSAAAHPVGRRGMLVAAKVLGASAVDLLRDPALCQAVAEDFHRATGGKPYRSPLAPDATPRAF